MGSNKGRFCAFYSNTGVKIWCVNPTHGKAIESRPLIIKDRIYIGGWDGCIHVLSTRTGKELPIQPYCTSAAVVSDLTTDGGLLFFTTNSGKVFALKLEDLTNVWSDGVMPPQDVKIRTSAGVTSYNGRCFVGFYDGTVKAFNCSNGKLLWSRDLYSHSTDFMDILNTPQVHNGRLFITGYSQGIVVLDPDTGRTIWKNSAIHGPSKVFFMNNNTMLVVDNYGNIWRLNSKGDVLNRTGLHLNVWGMPLIMGNYMLIPGEHGIAVVDKNLNLLSTFVVKGGVSAQLTAVDSKVFFMDNKGVFHCITVREP